MYYFPECRSCKTSVSREKFCPWRLLKGENVFLTVSVAKVRQNAEAMLKTYDQFSYENICYIINSYC